ncbi:phasin family protein [Kaistia dalseonensis]|uniref:Phasin n=1 Tax=Kaistia dalseonensis TaxID=410840 RepID=A0ABU0H723_9HYPH|nr:phasin family protein [Kaistia dalseonensis]MCX5495499.1 phasin family protein [Kaistia dalseonensis]MDQ0438091.1 phasin [Kaistia dalseonensis]
MADKTAFEIPEQMRAFADKSVDQAKKAFDDFMNATVKAVDKVETSTKSLQEGALDVNRKALGYIEENIAASFDFAQKMVRVKTIEELGELQQSFLKQQVESVQAQGKNMTEILGKVAGQAAHKSER